MLVKNNKAAKFSQNILNFSFNELEIIGYVRCGYKNCLICKDELNLLFFNFFEEEIVSIIKMKELNCFRKEMFLITHNNKRYTFNCDEKINFKKNNNLLKMNVVKDGFIVNKINVKESIILKDSEKVFLKLTDCFLNEEKIDKNKVKIN